MTVFREDGSGGCGTIVGTEVCNRSNSSVCTLALELGATSLIDLTRSSATCYFEVTAVAPKNPDDIHCAGAWSNLSHDYKERPAVRDKRASRFVSNVYGL